MISVHKHSHLVKRMWEWECLIEFKLHITMFTSYLGTIYNFSKNKLIIFFFKYK